MCFMALHRSCPGDSNYQTKAQLGGSGGFCLSSFNWWFLPLQLCVHLSVLSSCCNFPFPLCCLRLCVCSCPYSHAANQPIDLIEELEDERRARWDRGRAGKSVERLTSDAPRASALFWYLVRTFTLVCTTCLSQETNATVGVHIAHVGFWVCLCVTLLELLLGDAFLPRQLSFPHLS